MQITAEIAGSSMRPSLGRPLAEMERGCAPAVTDALTRAVAQDALRYLAQEDVSRLQRGVAAWLSERYGWQPNIDSIRPVADLVAGFRAVLTHLLPEGQPIIVPTPGYMPFLSVPQQIGHPVIEVPMRRDGAAGWRYDFPALRAAFEAGARLLVLCNPHNPIGKVATEAELAEVEALVAEFDGVVFADEIHAPLVLGTGEHIVYAARTERAAAHTITATSATKAFNIPGAKCGQLIFSNPEQLAEWRRVGHWHEHQTAVLGVVATTAAYAEGREWLRDTVGELAATVDEAVALLRATAAETGIRVIAPEATYLLWLDLSETGLLREGQSAAEAVREAAQVVVTDGSSCGAAGAGSVRFNAALSHADTMEAVRRLVAAAAAAPRAA